MTDSRNSRRSKKKRMRRGRDETRRDLHPRFPDVRGSRRAAWAAVQSIPAQYGMTIGLPPNVFSDLTGTAKNEEEDSPNGWETQGSTTDWDRAEDNSDPPELDGVEY
jgi:hypothetical protein